MANGGGNIYQTARKSAGLTQEAAAERLAVSLTSLRAYEGGERVPAGDVVARMCIVYDTQFLGVQHLQLFGSLLPECVQEARPEFLAITAELNDIIKAALALMYTALPTLWWIVLNQSSFYCSQNVLKRSPVVFDNAFTPMCHVVKIYFRGFDFSSR